MPFRRQQTSFIVIPGGAGPGDARIVIASALPPPLDTYTFPPANHYAGGIIFYPDGDDTSYTYLAVIEDNTDTIVGVHMGQVHNGAVMQDGSGFPFAQQWAQFTSTNETFMTLRSQLISLVAPGTATGGAAVTLSANGGGANSDILLQADDSITIQSGFAIAGLLRLLNLNGPVDITATGATADLSLTSGRNLNLNPLGELQMQGTRAYVLTQIQTNRCNAVLNNTLAAQNVPNCSITLPTVTTNARYKVNIWQDIQNLGGLNSVAVGELLVDGALQLQQALTQMDVANGNRYTTGQSYSGTLAAAGNHVFTMTNRDTAGAGNSQVQAQHTTITVEIFESGA